MTAILVLGSNYGTRKSNLLKALDTIRNLCSVTDASDIYETPDCLGSGDSYLNIVIRIKTELRLESLNYFFKDLEKTLGRDDDKRRLHQVPIDIDIVVWEGEIIRKTDFHSSYFLKGYKQLANFG